MTDASTSANTPETTFHVVNPVGYIVSAFESDAALENARAALLGAGFAETDLQTASATEVRQVIESLEPETGFLAGMGSEVRHQDKHLELAKQGYPFLSVKADSTEDTERAGAAIRDAGGAVYATKYGRLIIENLL